VPKDMSGGLDDMVGDMEREKLAKINAGVIVGH
jgi:hypothetical protein